MEGLSEITNLFKIIRNIITVIASIRVVILFILSYNGGVRCTNQTLINFSKNYNLILFSILRCSTVLLAILFSSLLNNS